MVMNKDLSLILYHFKPVKPSWWISVWRCCHWCVSSALYFGLSRLL